MNNLKLKVVAIILMMKMIVVTMILVNKLFPLKQTPSKTVCQNIQPSKLKINTDIIFTDNNEQKCEAKILGRARKATIECKKPDELTGQQTWLDTSACENLEIIQKENIQETEL